MVNASAFEEAIENYLTSLPANLQTHKDTLRDELKTTPEALLETVTTIEKNFSETSRFRTLVTRLNPCISQLQRFSRVIDACIQHQPHITALIWGSLKLVIQVSLPGRPAPGSCLLIRSSLRVTLTVSSKNSCGCFNKC